MNHRIALVSHSSALVLSLVCNISNNPLAKLLHLSSDPYIYMLELTQSRIQDTVSVNGGDFCENN